MEALGIIIATHGLFGSSLLGACERMLGPQKRCAALALEEGMGQMDFAALINAKRAEFGPNLVLVDMLGGTPWNASLLQGLGPQDEVLAGLSMPLLLEALTLRANFGARALAAEIKARAVGGVASASELLGDVRP